MGWANDRWVPGARLVIFVLDNNLAYEDHGLIFVIADPGFEAWLTGPFAEWGKGHGYNFTIVATAQSMDIRAGLPVETAKEFWEETRFYRGPARDGSRQYADPPPLPTTT